MTTMIGRSSGRPTLLLQEDATLGDDNGHVAVNETLTIGVGQGDGHVGVLDALVKGYAEDTRWFGVVVGAPMPIDLLGGRYRSLVSDDDGDERVRLTGSAAAQLPSALSVRTYLSPLLVACAC